MLKGEKKKRYQREYMRGYMKQRRADVKTPLRPSVKTSSLNTKLEAVGLITEGNIISKPVKTPRIATESVPVYDRAIHRTGDRVRMPSGKVVRIPNLDADGNVMP